MRADRKRPELMSPAGHWPELEAAIAAGADAVYFGLQHFTARSKVGFAIGELDDVIRSLHRRGVKGFVTFNTLVFDHELMQAGQAIEKIAESGADAIIVQDVGIAKLAKRIAPQLDVHGSTQMSITSCEGAELAASLGCSRVVLGRELSLKDIRRIAAATEVELEVFVHGALCVSYSGQCFSSEAWGGRSANRGQCAQACRLSYELFVDGEHRELGADRYLLSPGDLYAVEQVPELADIGIACFKIEGRYKGPDYVTLTTRAYRAAIDRHFGDTVPAPGVSRNELEQIYSRGLGAHFLSGTNHQTVVVGRAPRHRGLRIGTVDTVEKSGLVISTDHRIRPGDGLVFDAADRRSPDNTEEGGRVYQVEVVDNDRVRTRFGHGDVQLSNIQSGDWVWRTNDPQLIKKARRLQTQLASTTAIRFRVSANPGVPLNVVAMLPDGNTVTFEGQQPLEPANQHALNEELLVEQLSRLGKTPFHLHELQFDNRSPVFCPVSLLNQARRWVVDELLRRRLPQAKPVHQEVLKTLDAKTSQGQTARQDSADQAQLHILVRNAEQLSAAIESNVDSITLDYLELYGLRPSVEAIKAAGIVPRVASPRILKPSEQKVVRFLLSLECPLLIRSGGLLHDLVANEQFRDRLPELHGDFSLNAANHLSVQTYLDMGLKRMTPTYDLNASQIGDLSAQVSTHQLEVVAFQNLPVFHTEHCVFCRFLSDGTDHTNCGHPCEQHKVSLQDSNGRRHAVLADVGCRNTVFGAEAQFSSTSLATWVQQGLKHFRIEFVHQTKDQVKTIADAFRRYLSNQLSGEQLNRIVASESEQGTTEGSLFVPADFKQLVQLS